MSHQTETGETRSGARPSAPPAPGRDEQLEVIACDGCGRFFATDDGPGMMAVLKGPCPDCGGHFELDED
jgi:hypothetical protein